MEEVNIDSGRDKNPIPRLEAIHPVSKTRLGALLTPGFVLTDAFYAPLPEDKLHLECRIV